MSRQKKLNVLFASFEAVPFFKSGGLGDVAGTLPAYINSSLYDVRVILPKLKAIPKRFADKMEYLCNYEVPLGWRRQYCGLFRLRYKGVTYYFLDNEFYFFRNNAYGEFDDGERIAFFSKAVLETIAHLPDFKPDILHCNDWHTALCPVFLRAHYSGIPSYDGIKTIFTVHNLKFQGQYSDYLYGDILGLEGYPAGDTILRGYGGGRSVNYLQGALLCSDRITTVSPSYADEICGEYYGEQMDGIFRARRGVLSGILNGIDYKLFDPEHDPLIAENFGPDSLGKKKANKLALQKELGLEESEEVPVFALISRLTEQKGLDLLTYILPDLMGRKMQLVILGIGDRKYEEAFSWYAGKYPSKMAAVLSFDEALSHRIYAGADAVLIPSRFEPCGLTQMMAMRYGSLPVVRETGGLRDSVIPYNKYTGEGTGFSFANFNAGELLDAMDKAMELYSHPRKWAAVQKNAMAQDFSWHTSAKKYRQLYRELAGK
ncbi:MAG: glycogen synthase GlgA [Firmicutes bacterium]|nr:glycogen synthase GlgA [Bacillota bacterium]